MNWPLDRVRQAVRETVPSPPDTSHSNPNRERWGAMVRIWARARYPVPNPSEMIYWICQKVTSRV
jgi:hypothetical protein